MNARIALFLLSIAVVCLTTEALLQHSSRVSSLVNRACRTTGTDASNPRISCLMQKADTDGGSPVDSLIRAINDPNFSLGVGVAGIVVLLANRLSQDLVVSDIQSRADIIGVIASSALLLNVLSEQDITARDRDPVSLVGYAIKDPVVDAAMKDTFSLKWLVNTIISSTPATSVAVISQAKVVSAGGVVARGTEQLPSVDVDSMTILRKTIDKKEETYLPDLQASIMIAMLTFWCS